MPSGASDTTHIVLTFDDNRLASDLFGQFDQNLALIEQKLGVDARARGNTVALRGELTATTQARRTLDFLYERLQAGSDIGPSDVEGAIRMAIAADDQLTLPTMERKGKLAFAQISTRKKTIVARTRGAGFLYPRAEALTSWCSASARRAPARPGLRWPMRRSCSSARKSIDKIILTRPAVEAGERLGFLPGDLKEKVDPYLRPLYDALYDLMDARDKVERAHARQARSRSRRSPSCAAVR
jgi:phosphate starvation-inducible PhoH-like protein